MDHLKNFKTYEADQSGILLNTDMEALTTYYKCSKCNKVFNVFNEDATTCNKCGSNDIKGITNFDYFTELKNGDKTEYNKEFKKKHKREETYVDLVALGEYNRMKNYKRNIN